MVVEKLKTCVTLSKIEEMVEKIQSNIEYYKRFKYEKKNYRLFLADGSLLNVVYPKETIPHLLGVNIYYLVSKGIYSKSQNYFDILEQLCDNPYQLYTKIRDGHILYSELFSPFFDKKNEVFNSLLYQTIGNISFVCKYDVERTYFSTDEFETSDYFIFKEISDDEFVILGLTRVKNDYVPRTSIWVSENDDERQKMRRILKGQNITFLSKLETIDDVGEVRRNIYYNNLKIQKINNLKKYVEKYGCTISVVQDYVIQLKRFWSSYCKTNDSDAILESITKEITTGKVISEESLGMAFDGLDDSFYNLISSFNNLVSGGLEGNQEPYMELKRKNEELARQVAELLNDKERAGLLILDLEERNAALLAENNKYKDASEQIKSVLNSLPCK